MPENLLRVEQIQDANTVTLDILLTNVNANVANADADAVTANTNAALAAEAANIALVIANVANTTANLAYAAANLAIVNVATGNSSNIVITTTGNTVFVDTVAPPDGDPDDDDDSDYDGVPPQLFYSGIG